MKFNEKEYKKSVLEFKEMLSFLKGKTALIEFPFANTEAFYSLAPMSQALHELGADLSVSLHSGKSESLEVLESFWTIFFDLDNGEKTKKTKAMKEFLDTAEKRIGKGKLRKAIAPPEAWISAEKECFVIETSHGFCFIPFSTKWFKPRKTKQLEKTARSILKNGFALKKDERISIGFELMPAPKELELPIEDYLDSYQIAMAMTLAAKKIKAKPGLGAGTARKSKTDQMNRIAELKTIISGCEYDKKVKEPVFKKYSALSQYIKGNKWRHSDVSFAIIGKGYSGKHLFGTRIGYPSLDKKTRWPSPGSMMLKPWWNTQSSIDKRKPTLRLGITETLPIENFIRTCNVNYPQMRARNEAIRKKVDKSERLIVRGEKRGKYRTELEVVIGRGKKKRVVMKSDSDARTKINKQILKTKGIISGMFANYPGGEAFLTPESITGTAIGDVVINIDRSHVLSEKDPIVVEFKKGTWKILRAPAKIKKRIEKELKDGKHLIREYEKGKALPKKVIKMYKDNFRNTGEFAINTNPKAKLGNYLIENEKIARMIHIALGSGFEPDRQTVYHWDFVLNSPTQKLDIFGIDEKGREHWVIKKGKFVL